MSSRYQSPLNPMTIAYTKLQRPNVAANGLRRKNIILILFALVIFLIFLPYIMPKTKSIMECIFCKIVQRKLPETKIEYETDELVIFKDIKPASTHHYLAVSKRHIESLKSLTKQDEALVLGMEKSLKQFFESKGIDTNDALYGFHMPPFISVKHLHLHAISPRSTMSFLNRLMFRPGYWFKTVDEALRYIDDKA